MHNPYNSVLQERVSNYFDSGDSKSYVGFERATGVRVKYYHRTLEKYVATFRDRGLMLRSLCDVKHAGEEAYYFPKVMVLEFQKIPVELRKAA